MLEDCKVEFCGRTFECVDKGFEKNAPVDVVIRRRILKSFTPVTVCCRALLSPSYSRACTTR